MGEYLTAAASDKILSQLRKSVVALAILTPVHNAEAYGAELVDRVSENPGLAITAATAYPRLSVPNRRCSRPERTPTSSGRC